MNSVFSEQFLHLVKGLERIMGKYYPNAYEPQCSDCAHREICKYKNEYIQWLKTSARAFIHDDPEFPTPSNADIKISCKHYTKEVVTPKIAWGVDGDYPGVRIEQGDYPGVWTEQDLSK